MEQKWNPNAVIPRHSLFYSSSFVPKVGLPSTHILNQRPEKYGLLLSVVLDCASNKGRKRWKRVREQGIPVCQQIIRRHAMCDYHRLLDRYCPLPNFCPRSNVPTKSNDTRDVTISLADVSAAHSPSNGVVSFLRAVLRQVFPPKFWGSEHNFDKVLQVTATFAKLRRQEQLPNKALMNGIRVKDVLWIYGGADKAEKKTWSKTFHEAATTRMRNVMNWLFTKYLIPLLRSVFCVTESEFSAKRVLYYRKPVWSMFRSLAMKKLLVRQYREMSDKEAASLLIHQKMGFSRLRLLPKKSGVRALATLSKREFADFEKIRGMEIVPPEGLDIENNIDKDAGIPVKKRARRDIKGLKKIKKQVSTGRRMSTRFCSTNAILRDVFEVLRHERDRQPHLFGAGVFGLNEVYPAYRRFLEEFRQKCVSSKAQSNISTTTQLYFASVDIKQCYDNINQKHLLDILPKLISEGEYLIQNYSVIHPFESMGRVLKRQMKRIGPPESYCPFPGAVDMLTSDYNRSVFMNGIGCSLVRKEDVMELLREHLLSHVVVVQGRYGNRCLLQSTGIPQGSVLSTLLCNYYYGDVEKALLGKTTGMRTTSETQCSSYTTEANDGHATLLVRIVDDFLLVTTDRKLSTKFLTIMSAGNSELGVQINKAKTLVSDAGLLVNSDEAEDNPQCAVVDAGEDGKTVFPWCGMLFDTENGEVSIDYSRFAGGIATDALTVDRSGREGQQLDIRMKSFVRPRCQPMLFDPRINSALTVGISFMQALLLCAVKTVSYVLDGMDGRTEKNCYHIVRCIDNVILYTHKLITERLRRENMASIPSQSSQERSLHLKRKDAMWLGWRAFRSMFINASGCENIVALLTLKCKSSMDDIGALQAIENAAMQQFNSHLQY
jgi:telomerase reverse transcriptase